MTLTKGQTAAIARIAANGGFVMRRNVHRGRADASSVHTSVIEALTRLGLVRFAPATKSQAEAITPEPDPHQLPSVWMRRVRRYRDQVAMTQQAGLYELTAAGWAVYRQSAPAA